MRRIRETCVLVGAVAIMVGGFGAAASGRASPTPAPRFHVIAKTAQRLDSLVWTGRQFLYVQNTTNTVWAAPPAGRPLPQLATMPQLAE